MTSSRLIGRSAELRVLASALAEAADGCPSVAFVSGESGVGKSRLLEELMRRARDQGARVLAGDAFDFGSDGQLPYQPLVAAFRPLARGDDAAVSEPLRFAIAPLLPGLGDEVDPDARAAGDEGGSQGRLFEGLLALVDELGRERPLLLVLEDLHWADASTRAALAFLARNVTAEHALVVASYRPDELHRRHPLRRLLAELEHAPRARRVALSPLDRDELAEQLADILGAPPGGELVERLFARSGGNPLFTEELLAAGLDGRGAAPETLRDALMLRVERLSGHAQELLRIVAVAQRPDHRLLEQASGLEPPAVGAGVREAVEGHILVADDDGTYRFRHALLREVVDHDLLPGERSELHLTVGRALESRLAEPADAQIAAAIAHHFGAAGDQPAALTAALRAAAMAERVHAHGEVVALLDRALELWNRVPDPQALTGRDRIDLLVDAARAAAALGDPGRQLALLEAAFAELGARPDRRRAAPILQSMARAQRHLNDSRSSIATLERALELVAGDEDPAGRAGLLAELARARMLVGHYSDAARFAGEALHLAVDVGLAPIEGHARNTLGFSLAMTGDADAGTAQLQQAIALARAHGSPQDLAVGYDNYASMLQALGRLDEAYAVAVEGREAVAGRLPIGVLWLQLKAAEIAFDAGEWERSEASLPSVQRWTGAQSRAGIILRRAALALARDRREEAAALLGELEPLAARSSEPQMLGPVGVLAAESRLRDGDLTGARAAVDEWLTRLEFCGDEVYAVSAVCAAGVTVEADAAERARDVGDAQAESAALERLDGLLTRVATAADETRPVESVALLAAQAEALRGAGRPDPDAYARAAAAWESLGRPEPAARMRWREADAHATAGDRDAAATAATAAHSTAVRLGAAWLRAEIEGLAARARLRLGAEGTDRHAAGDPSEDDPFGLTPRERHVLGLLAEGATNREIGATLYMAEKTASVHVSRILAKLNARSRTEAATIAHRHGLAAPERPS